MEYVKPADVAAAMLAAGTAKINLSVPDLLIRGALSGAILGVATTLAFTGAVTTGQPIVGALIFPVGLVSIVLLGLELVTGSFALVPLPWIEGRASIGQVLANWGWVLLGNLLGSVAYGFLVALTYTNAWTTDATGVAAARLAQRRLQARREVLDLLEPDLEQHRLARLEVAVQVGLRHARAPGQVGQAEAQRAALASKRAGGPEDGPPPHLLLGRVSRALEAFSSP